MYSETAVPHLALSTTSRTAHPAWVPNIRQVVPSISIFHLIEDFQLQHEIPGLSTHLLYLWTYFSLLHSQLSLDISTTSAILVCFNRRLHVLDSLVDVYLCILIAISQQPVFMAGDFFLYYQDVIRVWVCCTHLYRLAPYAFIDEQQEESVDQLPRPQYLGYICP